MKLIILKSFQINFIGVTLPDRVQARASSGGTVVSSIRIIDENPELSISATHSDIGTGRTSTEITIESSVAPGSNLQIPFSISGLAARTGSRRDYTLTDMATDTSISEATNTVTLPSGQTSITWRMELVVDGNRRDEDAIFTLTGDTGYTVSSTAGSATVTIRQLRYVEFSAAAISVDEGAAAPVMVDITSGGSQIDPAVDYMIPIITGGTATAGADYSTSPLAVTLRAGDGTNVSVVGSVSITIMEDAIVEDDETLILSFGGDLVASGIYTRNISSTTVTITDNEMIVQFADAALEVVENGGMLQVTLELNRPTRAGNGSLMAGRIMTTDGTATAGEDYTGTTGSGTPVSFPLGGISTTTVTIDITNDNSYEADETFMITFVGAGSVATGARNTVMVTIADEDTLTIGFTANAVSVTEGDDVTVMMRLSAAPAVDLDIPYRWNVIGEGHAVFHLPPDVMGDFTPTGGNRGTLTFPADDDTMLTQSLTATTFDDNISEGIEQFRIQINAAVLFLDRIIVDTDRDTVTVTIEDNEDPVTVSFTTDAVSVAENADNAMVTIQLSAPLGRNINFSVLTMDGTATAGEDYTSLTRQIHPILGGGEIRTFITIDAGDTMRTISIPISDDDVGEEDETFTVVFGDDLTSNENGVTAGTPASVTVTITDNNGGPPAALPTVEFSEATQSVAENVSGGMATVTVQLSEEATEQIIVPVVTMDGTAMAGEDYTALTENVTFDIGDMSKDVSIAISNDGRYENNEAFTVEFGALPSNVTEGTQTSVAVTITDEDTLTILLPAPQMIPEDAGEVTLQFPLSSAPAVPLTFLVLISSQTATQREDFTVGAVTVAADQENALMVVTIIDDDIDEEDETFRIIFRADGFPPRTSRNINVPGGGERRNTDMTIIDNDDPLTVEFAMDDVLVMENVGMAMVPVRLSSAATERITFFVGTTANTATFNEDYRSGSAVVFEVNDTMATASVPIVNDNTVEADETFTVDINPGVLPASVTAGARDHTTVTIDSEDTATVNFSQPTSIVDEGTITGGALVTLRLTKPVAVEIDIPVMFTDGSAMAGTHYEDDDPIVNFAANDTSTSFFIPIMDDNEDNTDRTFTITILDANLPTDVTRASPFIHTVTIDDDDVGELMISGATASPAAATFGQELVNRSVAVNEGAGDISFTVQLNRAVVAADGTVEIAVAVTGTAMQGADFMLQNPGTIGEGASEATVGLMIIDDLMQEVGGETFVLTISFFGDTTGTPGVRGSFTTTYFIQDDDSPQP